MDSDVVIPDVQYRPADAKNGSINKAFPAKKRLAIIPET
jgi:hypothetical protein